MKRCLFIAIISAILLSSCALQIGEGRSFSGNSNASSYWYSYVSSNDASSFSQSGFNGFYTEYKDVIYPQTHVNRNENPDIYSALDALTPNDQGLYYYEGSYFAKVTANPFNITANPFDGLFDGSTCYFWDGEVIEAGVSYYFWCEPINWMVLYEEQGYYAGDKDYCAFHVISEKVLDAEPFDSKSNNYPNSSIRSWLNSTFFDLAFSIKEDRSEITLSNVDNSNEGYGNGNSFEDTQDYFYLPNLKELESYGLGSAGEAVFATDYALAKGATYPSDVTGLGYADNTGTYWTRSPIPGSNDQCYSYYGNTARGPLVTDVVGVRPCATFIE